MAEPYLTIDNRPFIDDTCLALSRQPDHFRCQGHLLLEDTKSGEEFPELRRVATDRLGDVDRAGGAHEADCRISDSGHYFWTGSFSDPACVFTEGDVAHVNGTDSRSTNAPVPIGATDPRSRLSSERMVMK
jgi:hypothetical protein